MAVEGIATFLAGSVDNFLATFVSSTSAAVSAGVAPLAVVGMTIWAVSYGLAVMRGEVQEPLMVGLKHITNKAIIFAIALSVGVYQDLIAGGATSFTEWFVSIVSNDPNGNIFHLIDAFDAKVSELALVIIGHGMTLLPLGGWMDLIAGIIMLLGSALMIVIATGFSLMAKVASAFMLGIGPAFIIALAFPPIAKFFEAWLGKVMNYSFLIIGLAVGLTMCLAIMTVYVSHFDANQDATNAISDAFGLVAAEGALLILLWQMPNIASGLGGGGALSGGGIGNFVAGMITGKMMGKGKDGDKDGGGGGGTIENRSGGGDGGSSAGGGGGKRVPAYRRATLDKLNEKKYSD